MSSKCFIKDCRRQTIVQNIFDHVETYHRENLIEIADKEKDEFRLKMRKVKPNAYLIKLDNQLYWYILKENAEKELEIGLFLVQPSEPLTYHIRMGEDNKENMIAGGPFEADKEFKGHEDEIPVTLTAEILDYIEQLKLSVVRLCFQSVSDDEIIMDMEMDASNVNWNKEENVEENKKLVEDFTCPVCFDPMRSEIYECINKHLICLECIRKIHNRGRDNFKCPICRGKYERDGRNIGAEMTAKLIAFQTDEKQEV